MDKRKWVLLLITIICLLMFYKFLLAITLGLLFSKVLLPYHYKLLQKKFPPLFSAMTLILCGWLLMIIPLTLFMVSSIKTLIREGPSLISHLSGWLSQTTDPASESWMQKAFSALENNFNIPIEEAKVSSLTFLKDHATDAVGALTSQATQLPSIVLDFVIFSMAIYLGLIFAEKIKTVFCKVSPFDVSENQRLSTTLGAVVQATLFATVVTAFAQAAVFGITCAILGVPYAILIGFFTFLSSLIPALGSLPITAPVVILTGMQLGWGKGIPLAIAAIFITFLDNLLRPYLMGNQIQIHPLLSIFAVLSGIFAFGFAGLFLGPVILIMFFEIFDLVYKTGSAPVESDL